MKPNELSIGDWLRLAGTEHLFQIEEVYKVENVKGKRIMFGGSDHEGGYDFYFLDELEPIPIDAKILMKNDFAVSIQMSKYYLSTKIGGKEFTEMVEIVYDAINGEWVGVFFGPEGLAMQVRIRYVHELQRILRCMGMNSELEL